MDTQDLPIGTALIVRRLAAAAMAAAALLAIAGFTALGPRSAWRPRPCR